MNVIGPIIIIFEAFWILLLMIRCNALKRSFNQIAGYLAGILNDHSLIDESISTVALAYGVEKDELIKILERKENESK